MCPSSPLSPLRPFSSPLPMSSCSVCLSLLSFSCKVFNLYKVRHCCCCCCYLCFYSYCACHCHCIVVVAVVRDGQLAAINNWLPRCKYPVNRVRNLPTAFVWIKQSILFVRYKLCYTFLCLVIQRKQLVKQKALPTFGLTLK